MRPDPDEEPTQPAPVESLAQLAAQWFIDIAADRQQQLDAGV